MYKFNPNFYADVRIEDTHATTIVYKNSSLDTYRVRAQKRAFIRVYDGDMWFYTSTCEIDNIQAELENLYKQATPNPHIAENPIVKRYEVNKEHKMCFENNSTRNVSKEHKVAVVEDACAHVKAPNMAIAQVAYLDKNNRYEFYSSKGADIQYDYQLCGLTGIFALVAQDGDFFQGFTTTVKPLFDQLNDFEEKVKKDIDKAQDFVSRAKPCKKGKFPVILSPMAAGMFAHESFGHKSEADFMLGDEQMAKEWVLGKKVGSDILSIVDDGADFGSGYVPFDDEGTRSKKTYLIKDGVLCGRLHSAVTASALNEELTGNARAMDCTFEPIVRMTNTYIEKGSSTFDELVAGIDEGYFVDGVSHGSGGTTFTIAPSTAYEIKNGKLGDPVKIAVVTGNVFETLNLIDGLTNNVEIEDSIMGGCGKMEQFPLHVADGGPYVRVKELNVQ